MTKTTIAAAAVVLGISGARAPLSGERVTLNGWFSDKSCAAGMLTSDDVRPNGTACVKRCLEEGVTAVFVDPNARAMYDVKDYAAVKDDVGYYLEVTGVVDTKTKTIAVRSTKRLGDVIQMCGRKRSAF